MQVPTADPLITGPSMIGVYCPDCRATYGVDRRDHPVECCYVCGRPNANHPKNQRKRRKIRWGK